MSVLLHQLMHYVSLRDTSAECFKSLVLDSFFIMKVIEKHERVFSLQGRRGSAGVGRDGGVVCICSVTKFTHGTETGADACLKKLRF